MRPSRSAMVQRPMNSSRVANGSSTNSSLVKKPGLILRARATSVLPIQQVDLARIDFLGHVDEAAFAMIEFGALGDRAGAITHRCQLAVEQAIAAAGGRPGGELDAFGRDGIATAAEPGMNGDEVGAHADAPSYCAQVITGAPLRMIGLPASSIL